MEVPIFDLTGFCVAPTWKWPFSPCSPGICFWQHVLFDRAWKMYRKLLFSESPGGVGWWWVGVHIGSLYIPDGPEIHRMAKQMRRPNQDICGEMPVRNNQGELCLDDSERMKAWVEHYKSLLNVEFPWDEGALPDAPPVEGPPPPITDEMVTKALAKMKSGSRPFRHHRRDAKSRRQQRYCLLAWAYQICCETWQNPWGLGDEFYPKPLQG